MNSHLPEGRGSPASPTTGLLQVSTVLAAGVVFTFVLGLFAAPPSPLHETETVAVEGLQNALAQWQWALPLVRLITHLGGAEIAWVLIPITVAWLLLRRLPRLAVYVALTGAGASVLSNGVKALVDRSRPAVDAAIATPADASFPSGHALGSAVTYGMLLLVFLPVIPARLRGLAVAGVISLVAAVGLSRVVLGVHYPSDVVGGWALGGVWVGVTAAAFRRWREREGLGRPPLREGLDPEQRDRLEPAPAHDSPFPHGWVSASRLVVAGVVIFALMLGLGTLLTDVLGSVVQPVDAAVVQWFARHRTGLLSPVALGVGSLGSTVGIVVVLAIAIPVTLALTRRWAPAVFLLAAALGETAIFLPVATLVARARPAVEHLSETLPPTASFPSGHVAAATVAFGGIALLARAWAGGRWAQVATAAAVLIPVAVALSRLYRGVHHPTDVIASLLYASAWLAVCWHILRPDRGARTGHVGAGFSRVPLSSGAER